MLSHEVLDNPDVVCRHPLEPLVQGTKHLRHRWVTSLFTLEYCQLAEQNNKTHLRKALRRQRRSLGKLEQQLAGREVAKNARRYRQLFSCQKVLAYSPIGGEISPVEILRSLHARIYLPRITHYRNGLMQFFAQQEQSFAPTNVSYGNVNLGIIEPSGNEPRLSPRSLDAVLMPLVAFDRQGHRLGQGGGFYDRCFAFKLQNSQAKRPLLIGLAHHFQEVESLFTEAWDVPLDAIITDHELILF